MLRDGFRSFFLGAGAVAVAGVALWLGYVLAGWSLPVSVNPALWHGHEMIFGFVAAAIAVPVTIAGVVLDEYGGASGAPPVTFWLRGVLPVCVMLLLIAAVWWFLRRTNRRRRIRHWARVAFGFALAFGLLWAACPWLFMSAADPISMVAIIVIGFCFFFFRILSALPMKISSSVKSVPKGKALNRPRFLYFASLSEISPTRFLANDGFIE